MFLGGALNGAVERLYFHFWLHLVSGNPPRTAGLLAGLLILRPFLGLALSAPLHNIALKAKTGFHGLLRLEIYTQCQCKYYCSPCLPFSDSPNL